MNTLRDRHAVENYYGANSARFLNAFEAAIAQGKERKQAFVSALTPEVKAEWINGKPVFGSPTTHAHSATKGAIARFFGIVYAASDVAEVASGDAHMQVNDDIYQPDVAVWTKLPEPFDNKLIVYPPCDLVVEVLSKETESIDRGIKFVNYPKAGIAEYWIVDAKSKTVERYLKEDCAYAIEAIYTVYDSITSEALAGAALPVAAFFSHLHFAKALAGMLAHLQNCLAKWAVSSRYQFRSIGRP